MKKLYLIIGLLSFVANIVAQTDINIPLTDSGSDCIDSINEAENLKTTSLPSLSLEYYHDSTMNVLERNYDYQLMNKKRKYEYWSKECLIIGAACIFAVSGINAWLANKYDWNLWIDIPCATVVAMGVFIPSIYVSRNLQKKADAIKIVPIAEVNINENTAIGSVMYVDDFQQSKSFGVQVKTKF